MTTISIIAKKKKSQQQTGLQAAFAYAMDLFHKRDPTLLVNQLIDLCDVNSKKRHFIRFVACKADGAQIPQGPLALTLEDQRYICVVDEMWLVDGEWWGYITSHKYISTSRVCHMVHKALNYAVGNFYTDELPWQRDEIKRYDYTKLQHFKATMRLAASGHI